MIQIQFLSLPLSIVLLVGMNFKPLDKSQILDFDNFCLDRYAKFLLINLPYNLPFNMVASLCFSFNFSCKSLFGRNLLLFLP